MEKLKDLLMRGAIIKLEEIEIRFNNTYGSPAWEVFDPEQSHSMIVFAGDTFEEMYEFLDAEGYI